MVAWEFRHQVLVSWVLLPYSSHQMPWLNSWVSSLLLQVKLLFRIISVVYGIVVYPTLFRVSMVKCNLRVILFNYNHSLWSLTTMWRSSIRCGSYLNPRAVGPQFFVSSFESADEKVRDRVFDVCADVDHGRNDDQLQQNLPDDSTSIAASKTIPNEDDSKGLFDTPVSMSSANLLAVSISLPIIWIKLNVLGGVGECIDLSFLRLNFTYMEFTSECGLLWRDRITIDVFCLTKQLSKASLLPYLLCVFLV